MKSRSLKLSVLGCLTAAGAVAVLYVSGTVQATPVSPGFASEILVRAFFERIRISSPQGGEDEDGGSRVKILAKDPSDTYVVRNTVAAGAGSGWHSHPGPSVVMVKSGVASVYAGDDPSCTPVNYPAGTGFVDAGGSHVHLVRNNGTEPLVTVAFQIVPTGAQRRIDEPNPGYCPF